MLRYRSFDIECFDIEASISKQRSISNALISKKPSISGVARFQMFDSVESCCVGSPAGDYVSCAAVAVVGGCGKVPDVAWASAAAVHVTVTVTTVTGCPSG